MVLCGNCQEPLQEGDEIEAVVLSVFRTIASDVSYAIDPPHTCKAVYHVSCREDREDNINAPCNS